jgi:hypothetical protein
MALSWFRTRSPERDRNTDSARLSGVRQAIEQARNEAQRENLGLQARVAHYHAKASSLLDHSAAYGGRSAEEESEITRAEADALRARSRVQRTQEQMELFEELLRRLAAFERGEDEDTANDAEKISKR